MTWDSFLDKTLSIELHPRGRSLAGLADLPEVEAELAAAASDLGIDWEAMCESDNTDCPV